MTMLSDDTRSMRQHRTSQVLCIILTIVALALGLAWFPVMIFIGNALYRSGITSSLPPGVEQQFIVIITLSFIPLILLTFFAVVLGRGGFKAPAGAQVRLRVAYWTVGLFVLTIPLGIFALLSIPIGPLSPVTALWNSLLAQLPAEVFIPWIFLLSPICAFFAVLLGGISLRRIEGTLSQRIWQYLARTASSLSLVVLVGFFYVMVTLLLFFYQPAHF